MKKNSTEINKRRRETYPVKARLTKKKYYQKNKEPILKSQKKYRKETNYKDEKTPSQRKIRNIKRKTKYHFPIKNQLCQICLINKAEQHYHTTKPIEVDQFIFICLDCHRKIHIDIREVKS